MAGTIRKDETDKVPLSNPVWFLVLSKEQIGLKEEIFQTSKTDLKALCQRLLSGTRPDKIYAVWNGNWNTHLFDMDRDILIKRLKDAGYWNEMIDQLPEDYEIHIYSCNKLNHRWHIVLMNGAEEITDITSMTLSFGLGLMEEYLKGEAFRKRCVK